MKKISEFIKPYVAIVLGALVLLYYLNWLSGSDSTLALGIIAMVMASYYLVSGILGIILGEKLGKLGKVFDIVSIVFFPTFMFIYFLLMIINASGVMGPAGWFINILSLAGSITFVGFYIVSRFVKAKIVQRLTLMFAAIFVLALLINILFDYIGDPNSLGEINIIGLVIYSIYSYMLVNALKAPEKAE